MIVRTQESKSQGSLFAFIDLLFLMVAFLVLLIFFMQLKKTSAESELENVQRELEESTQKQSALEETLNRLAPVLEQFTVRQHREAEKRRAAAAKEIRRRSRATERVVYTISKDGTVVYNNRVYTLAQFKVLIDNMRKTKWIRFRGTATPDTPFGLVVAQRRVLLENSNEFDTYWDNLTTPQEKSEKAEAK